MSRRPSPSPAAAAAAERFLDALFADETRMLAQIPEGSAVEDAIGIWHGGRCRFPAFQFAPGGRVRSQVAELKTVLPRDEDGGLRDAALWLFAPDNAFGGATPANVFAEAPDSVIATARARRDGSDACD